MPLDRTSNSLVKLLIEANAVRIFMWNVMGRITGADEVFLFMVQSDREDPASSRVRWTGLSQAECTTAMHERC
jgi:hypothetical protein